MSVRYALLALLSEEPKHGLQLREEFETWAGEAWPLNEGQVDRTLQRLEREGLVESGTVAAAARRRDSGSPPAGSRSLAGGCTPLRSWPFGLMMHGRLRLMMS